MVIYVLSLTLVPIFFSFLPPPKMKDTKHIEASIAKSIIDKAVILGHRPPETDLYHPGCVLL